MIRYRFIEHKVLDIYKSLPNIVFPIDARQIIMSLPNCRYMSYQDFANISKCSLEDVISLCESTFGCTHYDPQNRRYLVLCNHSLENNNNLGRQRWTAGHELGHIMCNHHVLSTTNKFSKERLLKEVNPDFEEEADYFTSVLLAPFPLFSVLKISTPADTIKTFGLSKDAGFFRFRSYVKWREKRCKTAWENDMIRLYKEKGA